MNKTILVGAPNSGKTTLYNWMTGSRFRTVNYPGSTVEFSRGHTLKTYGIEVEVIDTPGIRSLDPLSPDEEVTIGCLYEETQDGGGLVVVPVDTTQLERHLFMVRRLQQAGFSVIIALTMLDLLKEKGFDIDDKKLSQELGIPVYRVDGRLGGGVPELVTYLGSTQPTKQPKVRVFSDNQSEIQKIYEDVEALSLKVMISSHSAQDMRSALHRGHERTLKLDRVLMHPFWGLIFFVLIMAGLFTSIFWLAQPAMDLIDTVFSIMAEYVVSLAPDSMITDVLGNGLIAGVGSVIVFLPQIVILFFMLGLLEDSGYLARAASLVDKPLSAIGLNGRSFVPLLSGYACAIPAMMAARTITNRRERLLTLFAIPLMSCSARLPVFALLLGLIFKGDPFKAGLGLTAIYFGSLVMGIMAASIASRFIKNKEGSWFMLELPAYRRPHVRFVLKNVMTRSQSYIRRAGVPIVVISLAIWILSSFPNYHIQDPMERLQQSYLSTVGRVLEPIMKPMGGDWRMGVGILSAFAAREVFVSTLAVVFKVSGDDEQVESSLLGVLETATNSEGVRLFTTSTIIGLIFYFMIALQCLPTVAVSRAESGSRQFALVQLAVFTMTAYVVATATVQILRSLGFS